MFSPDPSQKIQKGNNRVAKVICNIFFRRAEIVQEQGSILLPKQSSGALKMFRSAHGEWHKNREGPDIDKLFMRSIGKTQDLSVTSIDNMFLPEAP